MHDFAGLGKEIVREVETVTLGFSCFGSSSSGNCYLIRSGTTCILVDVGLAASRILKGLAALGIEASQIDAVLLTHEHTDHVRGAAVLHRRAPQARFYATGGTAAALRGDAAAAIGCEIICLKPQPAPRAAGASPLSADTEAGRDDAAGRDADATPAPAARTYASFIIGDITVGCAALSHDAAEPLTYTFTKDDRKIAIVTDTGYIPEELYEAVSDADLLVLEANHEENILLYGRYPYPLKLRILSDVGHLSNETAGRTLCRILTERKETQCDTSSPRPMLQVYLAHVSRENNTPAQAFLTVRNLLEEAGFFVDGDLSLEVLPPDGITHLVTL